MHLMHVHLVQLQVYNDGSGYHDGWSGGNGWGSSSSGSNPNDMGWKDTIQVPGWSTVMIVVRWAPQNTPAGGVQPGQNLFPFDPRAAAGAADFGGYPGGPGYVWHCHRIEHEDNEMMRPYLVAP
jgi:FtsP/CotA-like multicopper oxidase with cupredoxin domain